MDTFLELACGTGIRAQQLLKIAQAITAIDASPEMLEINARKVADPRVRYRQADLFTWEPEERYDMVFFANWLSHVPPDILDLFLDKVRLAVRPEGSLVIVDQYVPTLEDQQIMVEGETCSCDDTFLWRPNLDDGHSGRSTILTPFALACT